MPNLQQSQSPISPSSEGHTTEQQLFKPNSVFRSIHSTPQQQSTTFYSKPTWIYHPSLFINNIPHPKAAVVFPSCLSVSRHYPRGPLVRAGNKSHQKTA